MLELASVLGTRVEQRWLHLLWNDENADSSERLEKAIEEATRAGVLERTEPSRLLRFHHGLLRKVAYRTIASDRIGHLHWRAGLIGAGTTEPMSPATVAAHLVRGVAAGSAAAALDACAVAAREASSRGAFDAAAALWRQALDMLALQPSAMAPEEAALRIQRATALDRAGRSAEAESDALRAFEIGERVDDPALQAKALLSCAPRIDFDGKVDDALVGRIEATLARLGSGDSVLRSRLLGRLVWATHHRRDGMEARLAVSAEALELARRLGDRAALATALEDRRMVLRSPQHQDEHDRVLREIIAVSRERGDDEGVLRATALSAWSRAARGRLTGAARRMAECRSSLRHVRSPDTTMQLYLWEMMNALLVGRWEEARRVINELVEFATAVDETLALAYAPNQALPEYLRGAGATEGAAAAAALFPARVELRVLFITALLDEGRGDEALDEWKSVRAMGIENEPADGRWLAHVSNLARIAADLEERDLARSLYHRLLPLAEWNAILGAIYTAAPFGAVARPLGLLATSLGLWDEAETHFQTAQRLHRQWNARPWLATTLHDHGHMRLRRGRPEDREAARALLNEAAALANDLEMPNLVRRLRTLPTS
jgi:tetratricopeptide (TPR) repeat protein